MLFILLNYLTLYYHPCLVNITIILFFNLTKLAKTIYYHNLEQSTILKRQCTSQTQPKKETE